jgi:imidazole glycerol phosphate synthase subunit HisF
VSSTVHVPVIACGGVGKFDHFPGGIQEGGASAVAASNIFAFSELSYLDAKDSMIKAGLAVRASRPSDVKRYAIKELNLNALLAV